jgi:2-amino-4-hydroxy-6-hydroxymethyldihydropteridine diphosphokinase
MQRSLWTPAYIALGSNLDDPQQQVCMAIDALKQLPRTRFYSQSKWYRSAPLGPQDQPEFVNGAAGVLTQLTATDLLIELKQIEVQMGRSPASVRWGARVIDLDLLVFGSQSIESETLTVPHPEIANRNFVLQPLADIAPDLMIPRLGRVTQILSRIDTAGLVEIH